MMVSRRRDAGLKIRICSKAAKTFTFSIQYMDKNDEERKLKKITLLNLENEKYY